MTLESQMILIFGATGDLNRRKLIPSFYHLIRKKRLTSCTPIVCIGRKNLSQKEFIAHLAIEKYINDAEPEAIANLLERIIYLRFDMEEERSKEFTTAIAKIQTQFECTYNKLIYLALPTSAFHMATQLIDSLGPDKGWRRVVFEKPFGENMESAKLLNTRIRNALKENEVFRVDHYLGKELVQNILTLRFANEIFAGSWGADAIDQVQITVSETLGVEKRAGYYDKSGAVRDMIQNHLLQLLSFVAMEPPAEDSPDGFRDEAVAVLHNLRPLEQTDIVLGQYGPGSMVSETAVGYHFEEGVAEDSTTETYAAIRAHIDTKRWMGVPFYLRTGKRLQQRYADIKIIFKMGRRHIVGKDGAANMVTIRIQPDEGIAMAFNVQKPGEDNETESVMMDFCHHCHFGPNTPEAYESILYNVMEGDHSLFPRSDWIEASWEYIDRLRIIAAPPVSYSAGTTGPGEANVLLEQDERNWL